MSEPTTEVPSSLDSVADRDIPADLFTVKVTGSGVEMTRSVDQATALNVISILLGGSVNAAGPAPAPRPPSGLSPIPAANQQYTHSEPEPAGGGISRMTVGEYIDECEAKPNPAKITVIGHYLQERLGQESFTRDEVKSQFRPAGEKVPGNYSRDFADAIAQRWVAEDPAAKGQYYVTNTGRTAIAEKFGKPIRRASTRRKKPTSKTENGVSSAPESDDFQELDDE